MPLNLTKIENGFEMNESPYLFENFDHEGQSVRYYIQSTDQVLVGTDQGIILFDLTVSIDNVFYNTIQEFTDKLFEPLS
jgi:hypothetical protein